MKWQGGRRSDNVIDRRGGGGRRGKPLIGGVGAIVVVIVGLYLGVEPSTLLSIVSTEAPAPRDTSTPAVRDEASEFVRVVLGDTETTWRALFAQRGDTYRDPKLVLFRDRVQSACGLQSAAVGPFYCPGDNQVYIDLSFFDALAQRYGAPGDFAQAYVIAHEVGHHIQSLTGVSRQVHAKKRTLPKAQANALSVRQELQADCYAGVWGHHAAKRGLLEEGDVEEGLRAAAAIGDDRLQKRARGTVAPESFTHGTSAQRVAWFRRGLQTGQYEQCDTFTVTEP
ncbi:MAG: neutral zinc metallopeptidase [Deltaproteobacteria bacterium]